MAFLVLIIAIVVFAALAETFGYDSRDHETPAAWGGLR